MNGCSSEALTKDQNSSSVYLLRSLTNVLNDTPTFCCTSPCSNFNPICHGVFLTFVVMQWGDPPPPLCSLDWQIVEVCCSCQQVIHLLWTKCQSDLCWRHSSFGDVIINWRHLPKFPVFYVFGWDVLFLHAFNIFFVFIC